MTSGENTQENRPCTKSRKPQESDRHYRNTYNYITSLGGIGNPNSTATEFRHRHTDKLKSLELAKVMTENLEYEIRSLGLMTTVMLQYTEECVEEQRFLGVGNSQKVKQFFNNNERSEKIKAYLVVDKRSPGV
jgi:hypothetical protein